MKYLYFFFSILTLCVSCQKDKAEDYKSEVEVFVEQLKNGNYDNYAISDIGEKLWLIMPQFNKDHIEALLDFSKDTTHISHFPTNPISSRHPLPEGRDYFILNECLLWTVEGIRNETGYGSLDPYLINTEEEIITRYKGISAVEIIEVGKIYQNWWNTYQDGDWKNTNPLESTSFAWF